MKEKGFIHIALMGIIALVSLPFIMLAATLNGSWGVIISALAGNEGIAVAVSLFAYIAFVSLGVIELILIIKNRRINVRPSI